MNSMKTNHTEGTWIAKDGQIYVEETGKTHAVIPYFDSSEEQTANANLMAAAPELLEILLKIQEDIESGRIDANSGIVLGSYVSHKINSAIQKATNP